MEAKKLKENLVPVLDDISKHLRRYSLSDGNFWNQIQLLIVANPICIDARFDFARICHNLAKTNSEEVKINVDLLRLLLRKYEC